MKLKYYFLLFFLFIFCDNVFAQIQSEYLDSLQRLLTEEKSDTGKLRHLNALAGAYSETESDSSLWYAQQALQLAKKIKDRQGEFLARLQVTYALSLKGSSFKALEAAFQNLQLAEKTKDTSKIILAMREISRTYLRMNDDSTTLTYAMKMKSLVHSGYFKQDKDVRNNSFFYINWMGHAFDGLNQIDSARYYRRLSYQIALSSESPQDLAIATNNLASLYLKTGEDDSAFSFYKRAGRYAEEAKRYIFVAGAYLGMGKLFAKKEQTDSALYYGRLSLNLYKRMKSPAGELDAATLLNTVFAKRNLIDSAYRYLTIVVTLKDSVFNQDKERQVQGFKFNEMLRQQQLEQERKEAQQKYESRMKIYSLLAGLAVLALIAFVLYRNNSQKQKTNILLQQQKQEIDQQRSKAEKAFLELKAAQAQLVQQEKMASLGELTAGIAHEIQNPLNFVNNFSELNAELISEMQKEIARNNLEEVKIIAADIEENEKKIINHGKRADSIVKDMLQHSRLSKGEKQLTDINALADEYLRLAFHGMRAKDKGFNATMETHFDSSITKVDAVPQEIGRVLLNLFNNAFYAINEKKKLLNGSYEPVVIVTTKQTKNKIDITVRDNGMGISEKVKDKIFQPFFTTKPTGEGTGLGLSLSYDIITKGHGGELRVNSEEGEFAEFIVSLPHPVNQTVQPRAS